MAKSDIVTRGVNTDEEFLQAIDLQAKLMGGIAYFEFFQRLKGDGKLWPSLSRENVRIALLNGKVVGTYRIFPLLVRIGCAAVPIGGINNVCTHPRYRKRGYMKALLTDGIEHMKQSGALISLLHGIPDFYYKFGYAFVGCDHRLAIQARVLTSFQKSLTVRKGLMDDVPRMRKLYDETNVERTLSLVRDDAVWRKHEADLPRTRVIVDRSNTVRGYFLIANRRDAFVVTEVCAETNEEIMQTLLAECGRLCRVGLFGQGDFLVPPDHPLTIYCQGHDALMETRYKRNSGWMMRITNLEGLFSAMEGELSRRVTHSHLGSWRGVLGFETDIGSVSLKISNGVVKCVSKESSGPRDGIKLPQSLLSQLLVGYRSAAELDKGTVPAPSRDIVNALFPVQYPFISPEDGF